jgi:hypothetical protein
MGKKLFGAVPAVDKPLAVVSELLDYLKVKEQETTARLRIRAQRDVLVRALENEKEIILSYFQVRFAERKSALEQLFALLQTAAEKGEEKSLDIALTGIVTILKENPLGDLVEFRKNMANPGFQLEL